ncbi:hypothetical protein [Paraburkholderia sp.]
MRNRRCGMAGALFTKEHIMTPSELDHWDIDAPVWTPYRPTQH